MKKNPARTEGEIAVVRTSTSPAALTPKAGDGVKPNELTPSTAPPKRTLVERRLGVGGKASLGDGGRDGGSFGGGGGASLLCSSARASANVRASSRSSHDGALSVREAGAPVSGEVSVKVASSPAGVCHARSRASGARASLVIVTPRAERRGARTACSTHGLGSISS